MRILKLDCPTCVGPRNCQVEACFEQTFGIDNFKASFRIVRCLGCERTFFQQTETMMIDGAEHEVTNSTSPAPAARQRPKWIYEVFKFDRDLSDLFRSVYTSLDNKLDVLTAIGCRTTFDRATHILGASPELSFAAKLKWLNAEGWIGSSEKDFLEILTEAGSAAAHRGWKPDAEQLSFMIDILEAFLHRVAVVKPAAAQMRDRIPKRQTK